MSIIRRSDGTTVYSGNHSVSRGSIESLSGRSEEYNNDDKEWEQAVLKAASGLDDFDYYYEDDENMDNNLILKLWGIYKRRESKFNSEYFKPHGR